MVQVVAPLDERLPSVSRLDRENKNEIFKMILRVGMHLGVYYPEQADYYTGEGFVHILKDGFVKSFPNLLPSEIEYAIKSGMLNYKFHTFPKLNDIMDLVRNHNAERTQWTEDALHNQKIERQKGYNSDEIHQRFIDVFKAAQKEAAEELEAEELAKRKAEQERLEKIRRKNTEKINQLKTIENDTPPLQS